MFAGFQKSGQPRQRVISDDRTPTTAINENRLRADWLELKIEIGDSYA
jgi:hypothetical protein